MEVLGWAITGLTALILGLVGLLGLTGWTPVGKTIRAFGKSTLRGFAFIVFAALLILGIAGGGIGFGTASVKGLFGGISAGAITGDEGEAGAAPSADVSCRFNTISKALIGENLTFRSDPADLSHYYVDVKYDSGEASFNGTLTCDSARQNIRLGAKSECYAKADSFKNQQSTTDSNTYFIVATSTSASRVPGFTWAQTVYLNNGAIATTSSDQEKTSLVYAQDDVSQPLGFYVTLPGQTVFNYLLNQTAYDVNIICDAKQTAKLTIARTAS